MFATCDKLSFSFLFCATFLVGVHQPKNIENTCFPPTKKGFCLISQCLPLFLLVLLGFLFRILFRIPFLNFLLLNLMFLVSSFYPRLLLLPSIFACPLSPFFFSSPVSVFFCFFMLCSLCWCLFTFVLMCFLVHVFIFLLLW